MIIDVTMRCPDPTCREACERPWTGEAGLTATWVHSSDQSPACGEPERIECTPDRATYTGRLWRIMEAREQARRDAQTEAARLVVSLPPAVRHCGDCDAATRLAVAGAVEAAWERAFAFGQDEYTRPHPLDRVTVS